MPGAIDAMLAAGIGLFGVLLLTLVSAPADRLFTRVVLAVFRDAVEESGRRAVNRSRLLQSVHATSTYPAFASETLASAGVVAIASSLVGTAIAVHLMEAVAATGRSLPVSVPYAYRHLVPAQLRMGATERRFVLLLASGAASGALGGLATYSLRWRLVVARSERRRVLIDESLARTIAFLYALSRSGMAFPGIVRAVGRNRDAFGEAADEMGVVVKDMDLFGSDLVTALERIARRTPSDQFGDFAENFANVLRSGQNVSAYLGEQYDRYQDDRIANQERLLDLFAAIGEGYVAVLVAGPLFLVTVLLVVGLLSGGTLVALAILVYGLIPLANGGFVAYVDSVSEPLASYRARVRREVPRPAIDVRRKRTPGPRASGGASTGSVPAVREMNRSRLAAYQRFRRIDRWLSDPVDAVVANPELLLGITVPLAVVAATARLWTLAGSGALSVATADDVIVQSTLLVVGTYAIVQAVGRTRLRRIEAAVPDLLDRLASTNEAGMTFTESLGRIDRSDLGALNVEVERLLADLDWGARTETALHRFSGRIGSSTVVRVVTLLTNAMASSGNLAPVIRIAADEAREDRRLRRSRRQELFLYVVIIYLAFLIFLGIGVALETVLVPALPSGSDVGELGRGPAAVQVELPTSPARGTARATYTLLLHHAAIVQAVCSGLVAGKMGEGSLANGAKHVSIMLLAAYAVGLAIG